ncbi:MAG: hypothetical protein V4488_21455 [Pseudomonadota bacterium]
MRIPIGGLLIHADSGEGRRMEVVAVELQLDTCVHWLEIAMEHLENANFAHAALQAQSPGSPEIGYQLDREFKASVQAAFAAATFFEALYAITIERNPPVRRSSPHSPKRKPPRYAVVAEQLRRSFGLKNQGAANLRSVLKETYRFRDQAVHPSAAFTVPVMHPQLNAGVESRFVMYSAGNVHLLVRSALAFSKILASRDLTRQPKNIQDLASYLLVVCSPLYALWEQHYGPLLDAPLR